MNSAGRYFDAKASQYRPLSGLRQWFIGPEQRAVLQLLNPQPGEIILDAGCGNGFYSSLITARGASVYGVDLSPAMIQGLRARGLEGEVADLMCMKLGRLFDKVLCSGALEFVEHPRSAISNLLEHVRPDGRLVLLAPRLSVGGMLYTAYHRTHGIRVWLFTQKDIVSMLDPSLAMLVRVVKPHPIGFVVEILKR